jgi:hypothetical protein
MRRFGCGLSIVGALLALASFALFGISFYRTMSARAVARTPVEVGVPFDSGLVTVDTAKLVQVAFAAKISSKHVERVGTEGRLSITYRFPFRYTVSDESGQRILEGDELVDDDHGMRTHVIGDATESGGSVRTEKAFEKFAVAPPGAIRVTGRLDADPDYGATVEEAEVVVYDGASKETGRVVTGVVLLALGGFGALLGIVLYVIGVVRGSAGSAATPAS